MGNWGVPDKPLTCEQNLINIENTAKVMVEERLRDGVLILIARRGDRENTPSLDERRLHNVRVGLTDNLGTDPEQVVTTTGERVRGYGRVEFYLRGNLMGVLLAERGKDLCVDCCDIDDRYYPYFKSKKRR